MATASPHILLVDDDRSVLEMVEEALNAHGMVVHAFSDGRRALNQLDEPGAPPFDLVMSDINMEGLDGFDVIHRVKSQRPHLPVVLMTAESSVEYAIKAMRMGAANFFMKPLALKDLVKSVYHLVEMHRDFRMGQVGLKGLVSEDRHFLFRCNDLDIPSLMRHLTERLVPMGFATDQNVDVVSMAFHEALVNALDHGNLELDSRLKGDLLAEEDPYTALRSKRLMDPAYSDRTVEVETRMDQDRFELYITDKGPGFDVGALSSAEDAAHQDRHCGRGLPLIQMVVDEVSFNEKGNQIRMVLNRK